MQGNSSGSDNGESVLYNVTVSPDYMDGEMTMAFKDRDRAEETAERHDAEVETNTLDPETEVMDREWELGVGHVVYPQVADGYAAYEIVGVGPEIVKLAHRPDIAFDSYKWNAVTSDGIALRENVESLIRRHNGLREAFDQ